MRLLGAALLTFSLTTAGSARTWYITPDGTGDAPTIQAGIDSAAVDGDEVVLSNGLFRGEGNRDVHFLGKAVTVRSVGGDPVLCVIDCEGVPGTFDYHGGFFFTNGEGSDSILEGVTVTGGWYDLGGAVSCGSTAPTIRNCVFRNNNAWEGGAIFCQWSSALFEDCVIVENAATEFPGGGVFLTGADVILRGCTISYNESGVDPSGNRQGGGIAIHGSTFKPSLVTIENCLVSHALRGEGIYCDEVSTATISCTDIFGNAGGDWVGSIAPQGNINGNFSADPLFCDPDADDFTLHSDSPCLPGNHPTGEDCGLIGALRQGCGPVSVERESWARTKSKYR
jgi:hypothetical protein